MGDQGEIEFTPAYSGRSIRVRTVARNGNCYSYGAEFVASSDQERKEIASQRENVQTLSSAYSPSFSPPSNERTLAPERRHDALPRSPRQHPAALLNVSSASTAGCAPLPAGSPNLAGKSRRGGQRAQLRNIGKKLRMPGSPRRHHQLGMASRVRPRLGRSRRRKSHNR
jgi:hypothetical protein